MDPAKVQEGLEKNKAFQEYKALSREEKNSLKTSALEAPDLSKIEDKDSQIFALQDIVRSDLEVIADLKRQLQGAKNAFAQISQQILDINNIEFVDSEHQSFELSNTVMLITKTLIDFAGTSPETKS